MIDIMGGRAEERDQRTRAQIQCATNRLSAPYKIDSNYLPIDKESSRIILLFRWDYCSFRTEVVFTFVDEWDVLC